MVEIVTSATFDRWLLGLRDPRGKARVLARVERLAGGFLGDVQPVGQGISELRIHFGPGYRVYFMQRGQTLILILAGGDKSSQDRDIARAKAIANDWRDE
jgi:putative addiction module killer protein